MIDSFESTLRSDIGTTDFSPIFFIGLSDAHKYDIIWTDNKTLIDRFLPEIMTCSKLVQHVFGDYLNVNISCR